MKTSKRTTVYGVVVIEGDDATVYRTTDQNAMLSKVREVAAAGLQYTVVRKHIS